jgi:superfamily II DNA or RNA helicase
MFLWTCKLITVESVEHGEMLLAEAKKIDKDAVFVHGKSKNRDEIKDMFVAGKLRTVIATRIYNESADIPILKIVVNAAGGKSGNAVLQRLGRQLRLHATKDGSRLYDFRDLFNYKMEQHSMERIKWLKKEGHTVKTMLLSTLLSGILEKPNPKKRVAKKVVKKRTKSG